MNNNRIKSQNTIINWINYRLPIFSFFEYFKNYQVPKNLNYMWNFGMILTVSLIIQIITGIVLAMHYTPHVEYAFESIQKIMQELEYGWLIRNAHSVGASMIFVSIYLHISKALYYGSYKTPRELLWHFGIIILLLIMMTAFTGHLLSWNQIGYWGTTVISNMFANIPVIGNSMMLVIRGGFNIDSQTLTRFFTIHYLLAFIIIFFVILHIISLHTHGPNNPDGIELKTKDKVSFYPYHIIKEFLGLCIYLLIFTFFIFFAPNYLQHTENHVIANQFITPHNIMPEWYFLPFYGILKSCSSKPLGILLMFLSIFLLFLLPWLDKSEVRSGKFRPKFKIAYWIFIFNYLLLGYLGTRPVYETYNIANKISTLYYFIHFLIVIPIICKYEKSLI